MSNTFSAALVCDALLPGVVTPLTAKLASLKAFSRRWEPDPIKPKAKCQLKIVRTGSTTQTDPTNFQVGDSLVENIEIVPSQLSHSFQVSNANLQSGLTVIDLYRKNISQFGNAIMQVATAPISLANFPAEPLVASASSFGLSDLDVVWGQIAKSDTKNLILDGRYFVKLLNKPGFFQPTGTANGAGWKPFGWDLISQNDEWAGASNNAVGFACNPQAIAIVAGLPAQMPSANLIQQTLTLPDLDFQILFSMWMDAQSRTSWMSFDCMFGAALADSTAGVLITTS